MAEIRDDEDAFWRIGADFQLLVDGRPIFREPMFPVVEIGALACGAAAVPTSGAGVLVCPARPR